MNFLTCGVDVTVGILDCEAAWKSNNSFVVYGVHYQEGSFLYISQGKCAPFLSVLRSFLSWVGSDRIQKCLYLKGSFLRCFFEQRLFRGKIYSWSQAENKKYIFTLKRHRPWVFFQWPYFLAWLIWCYWMHVSFKLFNLSKNLQEILIANLEN
jgi:hypothetical protein